MLRIWIRLLALLVGAVAGLWQIALLIPVLLGLEAAPIKSQYVICAQQMATAISDIQRDVAAGETPQAAWLANYPGHCPGVGAGDDSYLFVEDGLSDTEVPVTICRRGGHLAGSRLALGGYCYGDTPTRLIVGYTDRTRIYSVEDGDALLATLKTRGIVALDRTATTTQVDSMDPNQQPTGWYFNVSRGTPFPTLIIIIAVAIHALAGLGTKPKPDADPDAPQAV